MTAQSQLEQYLERFRARLRRLIVARASALLAAAALAITLIAVFFGMRRAFDSGFVIGARGILFAALAAIVVAALIVPLRRLRASRAISDIEHRVPEFQGRLETFDGLQRNEKRSPFLGLLAEDAMRLAAKIPVIARVRPVQINAPIAVAVLCGLMLLGIGSVGPDTWRYGVRHLWAGWLFDDTLPPQRIAVEPGDGAVRRGGDLSVSAMAEGFSPASMTLYAQLREGAPWQSTLMDRGPDSSFEFTFFAVREPVSYYVEAAGIRSPQFTVTVADLPEIQNIRLSYAYPEWTRLEPQTEDPGGDIRAVAGTEVTVEIETDRPLGTALLDVDGQAVPMQIAGNTSTASITVSEEGEYFFATDYGDDVVRLSEDYFIDVVEDEGPVVDVVRPGRDWRASNIEEVSVKIQARDDFGIDMLELHYSINGDEWRTAAVPADGREVDAEEILYLEEMTRPVRQRRASDPVTMPLTIENLRALRDEQPDAGDDGPEPPAQEPSPALPGALEPGDLISYFVVAEDREQRVESDLFFIEVQPFDRRFSQAASGGGGGGGGQQQNEISARQKEILVATWNLIREQDEEASFLDEQQLADNAAMLAELQTTLAEQARTLAQRTRARQLTNADDRIERFVEALELAAEAMDPAAERLSDVALDDAVPSEQEALQHLLRAESVFTDIQVAFQRNGGGGGGLAGRDLSELFELEMDLEKNQYETETPVAMDQEQREEQEVDEAIAKLQELARRQENLARQAQRRQNLTEQERWQQEQLRRETEQLRRELEQLQQRMAQAQQQQQQGQQQGQEPGQQQGQEQGESSGQPGQPGQGGQGNARNSPAGGPVSEDAMRDLNNALQAMNRAAQGGEDIDPEQARRAIEQARRELDQALEQMTAQRQTEAAEAFSDLAERSAALFDEQRQLATRLQQALENALDNQIENSDSRGGLPREQANEFSDRKAEMWQELESLEEDIQRVAQDFRGRTPEASGTLDDALADLQQMQGTLRLQYGAQALRQGGAQQVAATDAVTTSALRDLQRSTESALERARVEAVEGENRELGANEQLVAEIQSLRRQLADMAAGGGERQPGTAQSGQPQPGEQPPGQAQPGQSQSGQAPGQQPGTQANGFGGQLGGDRRFGGGRGYYDPNRIDAWGQFNPDNWRNPEDVERLREQLNDAGRQWLSVANRLRAEGVSDEELRAMRELGEAMRGSLPGNPELIAEEFRNLVNLAEQLELQLRASGSDGESAIRAEAPSPYSPGYEESVAEYFRRLSRTDD